MRVYVDMDGVLADFMAGVHRAFGLEYSYDKYPYTLSLWEGVSEVLGIKRIDSQCTSTFWANLDFMHDGYEMLVTIARTFSLEAIHLVTTPMPNLGSWEGKAKWVEKNLPAFLPKHLIIMSAPKYLLAQRNTLLIDDKDSNVKEFIEHKGKAILIPRPWNSLYKEANRSLEYLNEQLEKYQK